MKASFVIPNWNGRSLLERNLPAVIEAAGECEVIVVDDASTDGSVELLSQGFPSVHVVRHDMNRGFSAGCMSGVRAASGDVVVLLNTDVRPRPDFLAPLLRHFAEDDVFAVSCLSIAADEAKTIKESFKAPVFRRGLLKYETHPAGATVGVPPGRRNTLFATGGHCAIHRGRFLELGGFDELFKPFYCEDLDLCYRAWKRGWRVIYEPESVVVHEHKGTIGKAFGLGYAQRMNRRNRLLFVWKNISSPGMFWLGHVPVMALRALFGWLALDLSFYAALFSGLGRLPKALKRRRAEREAAVLTDDEVFRRIGTFV